MHHNFPQSSNFRRNSLSPQVGCYATRRTAASCLPMPGRKAPPMTAIYVGVGGNRLVQSTSRLWTIVIDRRCTISTGGSTPEGGSCRRSNDRPGTGTRAGTLVYCYWDWVLEMGSSTSQVVEFELFPTTRPSVFKRHSRGTVSCVSRVLWSMKTNNTPDEGDLARLIIDEFNEDT